MKQFEFTIHNTKVKFYDRFAIFIMLINLTYMLFDAFFREQEVKRSAIAFAGAAIAIFFTIAYLVTRRRNKKNYLLLFATGAVIAYWLLNGPWLIAPVVFVLYFLYVVAGRKLIVAVAAPQISYPSFPVKLIKWDELDNLVLRDGLLTIDFRNNRIIQQKVEDGDPAINERDFNDFCHEQLKQSAQP